MTLAALESIDGGSEIREPVTSTGSSQESLGDSPLWAACAAENPSRQQASAGHARGAGRARALLGVKRAPCVEAMP